MLEQDFSECFILAEDDVVKLFFLKKLTINKLLLFMLFLSSDDRLDNNKKQELCKNIYNNRTDVNLVLYGIEFLQISDANIYLTMSAILYSYVRV